MRQFVVLGALSGACLLPAGALLAQRAHQPDVACPAIVDDSYTRAYAESSPSDRPEKHVPGHLLDMSSAMSAYGSAAPVVEPSSAEPCYGCDHGCSDCYGGWGSCLGSAWTFKGYIDPCCTHNVGGWMQWGYHSDHTRFSDHVDQGLSFNDRPHELNLHQAWLYFEKVARSGGGADWGCRFDILYGIDAQKTQAFGNPGGRWDVTWDHGAYGWAIPQVYGEVAFGDWSVKLGKFFTIVGYEVVPAPGNFFYSHSFTHFNSEPFTHTGILATYTGYGDVTLYAGWTLGWDTGFDQFGGGSNWLGGFSAALADDVTYTYISTAGDFGWRGEGYSHSNVLEVDLTRNLQYVLQSDYLRVRDPHSNTTRNQDVGINQYLFYSLTDCWQLGTRMEWWKSDWQSLGQDTRSYYAWTGGINYRPDANVVIRPEIRYNWTPADEAYFADWGIDFNQWVFGIDALFTF